MLRISDKKQHLIDELRSKELSIAEISRLACLPYQTTYIHIRIKELGHESYSKYREYLAKKNGYLSRIEYEEYLAMERIDSRTGKKFESLSEYKKYLGEQRQLRPVNRRLSHLVRHRLAELRKTQKWLSQQLGITSGQISKYSNGKIIPEISIQEKLFGALGLPYKTLEDLAEEIN